MNLINPPKNIDSQKNNLYNIISSPNIKFQPNVGSKSIISFLQANQMSLQKYIDKQSQQKQLGQVIKLAYLTDNKQIHLNEQALQIFRKYNTKQIAFIGIYGEKNSGKSLFYDNILSMADIKGNNFYRNAQIYQKGLYLYNVPFKKTSKSEKYIFMIECTGFDSNLLQQSPQNILLDLLLLLCSSIIFISSPSDAKGLIFDLIEQKIIQSTQRITQNNLQTIAYNSYWPQNIYCLFRNKSRINDRDQALQNLFTNYNFTVIHDAFLNHKINLSQNPYVKNSQIQNSEKLILNQNYRKQTYRLMLQVIDQIQTKKYLNLTYNGNICCKLLLQLTKNLNNNHKQIKIDKIFYTITRQIYDMGYQYHITHYDNILQEYFIDDKAYSYDYILNAFKTCQQQVFYSFYQININEELNDQYENKLDKYIQQKQKLIIDVNKKKTHFQLKNQIKKQLKIPKQFQNNQSIQQIAGKLKQIQPQLNHEKSQATIKTLSMCFNIMSKKNLQKIKQKQQKVYNELTEKIKVRRSALQQQKIFSAKNIMLNNQKEKCVSMLNEKSSKMQLKIKNLQKQLQSQKKSLKKSLNNKQMNQKKGEKLLSFVRQLQEKFRENEKIIAGINEDFQYDPQVLNLNKKIQQVIREQKNYEKNQSMVSQKKGKKRSSQIRSLNSGMSSAIKKSGFTGLTMQKQGLASGTQKEGFVSGTNIK